MATGGKPEGRTVDIVKLLRYHVRMMRLTEDQAMMVEVDELERMMGKSEYQVERGATRCPVCQAFPNLTDEWSYSARGGAVVFFVCDTPACSDAKIPLELNYDDAIRACLMNRFTMHTSRPSQKPWVLACSW